MFRTSPFLATALIALALMGFGSPASAREDKESGYDQVWAIANLYTGDDDSFFQTIDLSGRLQLDLAYVKSQDDDAGEFNVRRFRFGFKTVFLEDFTLHVEGEFNPQEIEPLYTRITDAYLAWAPGKAVKLTLGKHSAGFTLDGLTSSKRLLTIDRNNLTQNIWFTEEYIPGISVKGEGKGLVYHVGLFSSGDKDPEFGDFKGGKFILINVGHDFADRLGAKEALLRFNYIDNEPDPENGFTKLLEQIWSLNFKFEDDGWGFRTDISAGYGYEDQSDMWGYVLMPFYELTDSLELVGPRPLRALDRRWQGRPLRRGLSRPELLLVRPQAEVAERYPVRRHERQGRRRWRLHRLVLDDRYSHLLVKLSHPRPWSSV
jgi:phosphate-selective porin OprO/OprP